MGISYNTKMLLAREIKNKARSTPIRKITVSELCAACGLDRRTFYYHFRDVYDLTAWIFDQAMDDCLPWQNDAHGLPMLAKSLNRLRDDAPFYRRALAEDSQNALGRHFLNHYIRVFDEAYLTLTGLEDIPEPDKFAIRYHCFGSLGVVRRWLFDGCVPSAYEMAELLRSAMPTSLQRLYDVQPAAADDPARWRQK